MIELTKTINKQGKSIMRILAVIPARAGSKGIPNKNIRMLHGYPLVYYAIHNAIVSQYITDIIVTTDSDDVRIIAQNMGVNVKCRSPELCGDDVTLDAVVYDAVDKSVQWDYIITMQPTSPTLSAKTLDSAIQYAIDANTDTLISAVNKPHLGWLEENGRKVPDYKKRLNRQYMPPHYMETGAFVISKASAVSPVSRIGDIVDVFEVPENEALDIDSFTDLYAAEACMKQNSAAIYVNGNNKRGTGHVYRALELADELYTKPDIYYDINQTDAKIFGNTTHNLIPVRGIVDLFDRCRERQYNLFINDILSTSIDYMIGLRSVLPDAKIINFEDDGEGILKADMVFNALYTSSDLRHVYAGEKYYIPRKIFMFYKPIKIAERVKSVFISYGGGDPCSYTDRLLGIISKPEYKSYNFTVVLGRAKHNAEELMRLNIPNIKILFDVSNMPEVMTSCDIAMTSRGRTGYELAMLGIPSIAMAQNTNEEKHYFISNENGFTYIGLNPDDEIIEGTLKTYLASSRTARENFQKKLLSHDLRRGRKRVMDLINSLL